MISRFFSSSLLVLALATAGCAVGADETTGETTVASTSQELATGSSLLDTVKSFAEKAGPGLDIAGALYDLYSDVPGKLDAMNAKLDSIAGDVTLIKAQIAAIDTKMDNQYNADILAPIQSSENFVALDMKDLMATLKTTSTVDDGLWSNKSDALNTQYAAVDAASEKILAYFTPSDATAAKWTPAQWFRIYSYYLRASLAKLALRDAQATLTSTYWERAPLVSGPNASSKEVYAARKQVAIADLGATAKDVAKKLRPLRDFWVAARDIPGLQAQQCFQNGTERKMLTGGGIPVFVDFPLASFRDVGAQYTSPQYQTMRVDGTRGYPTQECEARLGFYKADTSAKVDAFVKESLDAPIASIETIPGNWNE